MNTRLSLSVLRRLFSCGMAVLALGLFSVAGCHHPQTRAKVDEDPERDKDQKVITIGDVTEVSNADGLPVSGVGLVVGLEGTGGSPPPGGFRTLLEDDLRHQKVEHIKEILASTETAMVMVSAVIPAGAHKGDLIDVEVTLPAGSKATSLRGGYLRECKLVDYDSKKNISPNFKGGDSLLRGHPVAKAEGPLQVGLGEGDEAVRLKQARIWKGGKTSIERPFYLVLKEKKQFAAVANRVAQRINETLQGPYQGPGSELAAAQTNARILLRVPQQYKYNMERYLRVVRLIPLVEKPEAHGRYRQKLAEQLMNPAYTVTAALRLEALGGESTETLKRGLKSDRPLVRFCSAEALAYMGNPVCGEVLARTVEDHDILRALGLAAMASLDEGVCRFKLTELLSSPSKETRYGAFLALRLLDEHEETVQGEFLNESFWLHRLVPNSAPLVHLSTSRKPEIVLFGKDAYLVPPFNIVAGEFVVAANRDDEQCIISRLSAHHPVRRRPCSFKLEEAIRTLADMGGLYPDVAELLRKAANCQCLNCEAAVDALPQDISVFDLANHGTEIDEELQKTRLDIGAAPAGPVNGANVERIHGGIE